MNDPAPRGRLRFPWLILGFVVVAVLGFHLYALREAEEGGGDLLRPFPRETLTLTTPGGVSATYNVEVATTPDQQARGLMFRRTLPDDSGMLFLFDPPQIAQFWMKNTYLPLDLLFIGPEGRVVQIVERARPLDTTPLLSREPVMAVLELNGGESARQRLAPGAKAQSPSLEGLKRGR